MGSKIPNPAPRPDQLWPEGVEHPTSPAVPRAERHMIGVRIRLLWRAKEAPIDIREDDLFKFVEMPCLPPKGTLLHLGLPHLMDFVETDFASWDVDEPCIFEIETNMQEAECTADEFRQIASEMGWSTEFAPPAPESTPTP